MKAVPLEPCFIFILFVISTTVPTCLCEDDSSYTTCSNAFRCGSSVTNLKYPFWGRNRDKYCGSQELTCEENVPKITIHDTKYRILHWDDAKTLTVARDDWSNICVVGGYKNITFDNTPFQYDYDVLFNLTLYYECSSSSNPNSITNPYSTGCGNDVYYTFGPFPYSYTGPCKIVVIPISQNITSLVSADSNAINTALNDGFGLEWTGNQDQCKTCTDSDGKCGFDAAKFQCFCKDGLQNASCPHSVMLAITSSFLRLFFIQGKRKVRLLTKILIIASTIVAVTLIFLCYYLTKRKSSFNHFHMSKKFVFASKKNIKSLLRENFGNESVTLEHLRFNLATIITATNNFSNENRIGKGGFGEVYKGILLDGRQIAVKRLSKSSMQGANEFKNEVLVIAKLQHRNLVTFIGFCLEGQNKILIYEYVSNKSLDYFLFDSQRSKLLNWFERYNIIEGIAKGILYLHELSRLKVIHRDLKPSNVLLDENMIPKISDFGLAKIVEINQDHEGTNRIVGTFGYMSPEYVMFGQFSEKSDVFSFGVMILEIITGKKNLSSYELHRVADGLLSYVWKQWRDQTLLSILDPSIEENYSKIEVVKCIQIGLLCVQHDPNARPTMSTVVSYLSNYSINLPTPKEPAFFLHGRMDPTTFPQESSSNQFINRYIPLSINEMSISEFLPR
ncbi:cysteine-rich receptor-like protein kinase 18 isoform X2 [Cajanus cajan]|uniref:cysteine-rich receptor-like protein kinase 18 isoform X2 n=1 Tax=Cajanus cajan TaxID=3821 RepID=UPI0010FB1BD0|nr:cysteine-rich receptor-like protein kinase 18 isoform X2 [Cajanus cajan]